MEKSNDNDNHYRITFTSKSLSICFKKKKSRVNICPGGVARLTFFFFLKSNMTFFQFIL